MLKDRAPKAKGHEGLVANSKKRKEIKNGQLFLGYFIFQFPGESAQGKSCLCLGEFP